MSMSTWTYIAVLHLISACIATREWATTPANCSSMSPDGAVVLTVSFDEDANAIVATTRQAVSTVEMGEDTTVSIFRATVGSLAEYRTVGWSNTEFSGNLVVVKSVDELVASTRRPWSAPRDVADEVVNVHFTQRRRTGQGETACTVNVPLYGNASHVVGQAQLVFGLDTPAVNTTHATVQAVQLNVSYTLSAELTPLPTAMIFNFSAPSRTGTNGPVYGGGEQYNTLDLLGNVTRIILTREQGVGRGLEPLTEILNLVDFVGGSTQTNYAARPILSLPLDGWVMILRSSAYSELFTPFNSAVPNVSVSVFLNDTFMSLQLAALPVDCVPPPSTMPLETAELVSALVGRPPPLPPWVLSGVIVGMQGGTDAVLGNLTVLRSLGCPMSAFWLQDWTGQRPLDLREGLWWNWEWNSTHYPNLTTKLLPALREGGDDIRLMTYINPMLVDNPGAGPSNMYAYALDQGFFVRHGPNQSLWTGYNGASLLDLTNPNATRWYKGIIQNMIQQGYSRGWMCDFGEAMPLDAVNLWDRTVNPASFHNEYPDAWFRLNREAIDEIGMGDEIFFFGRSAWINSQTYYSSGWSGDQLCNFDAFDGLASAVTSMITSGLSGTLFQHSDTGGYNAILWYERTEELFLRWCEVSAMSPIFRTHDGSNPHQNWQFYRTPSTTVAFTRYAQLYAAWGFYRQTLAVEAVTAGRPVVRAMLLHFPNDADLFSNLTSQYLLGSDILVAPVMAPSAVNASVVFPSRSCWVHVWSRRTFVQTSLASVAVVEVPVGCPAIFVACNSSTGDTFLRELDERNVSVLCRA